MIGNDGLNRKPGEQYLATERVLCGDHRRADAFLPGMFDTVDSAQMQAHL